MSMASAVSQKICNIMAWSRTASVSSTRLVKESTLRPSLDPHLPSARKKRGTTSLNQDHRVIEISLLCQPAQLLKRHRGPSTQHCSLSPITNGARSRSKVKSACCCREEAADCGDTFNARLHHGRIWYSILYDPTSGIAERLSERVREYYERIAGTQRELEGSGGLDLASRGTQEWKGALVVHPYESRSDQANRSG